VQWRSRNDHVQTDPLHRLRIGTCAVCTLTHRTQKSLRREQSKLRLVAERARLSQNGVVATITSYENSVGGPKEGAAILPNAVR
jgi:hypothetical protein